MAGGMDILIVGIGDKDNFDDIASDDRLHRVFNEPPDDSISYEELQKGQERLTEDPNATDASIRYIKGEVSFGAANGAALGYLVKSRFPDDVPEQVPAQLLVRVQELSDQFREKMKALGLSIGDRQVGLWMQNIRDT